jgi:hypothetical protein
LLGALIVGGPGDRHGSQHAASRRTALCDLRIELHSCVELKSFVVAIPRRNRHRWILDTRAGVSRGSRAGESARSTGRCSKSTS